MEPSTLFIGGLDGFIFEGEAPQTCCFVPAYCLSSEDGVFRVDEGDYVRSGWGVRNMRFNDAGGGQHLFPDARRPIVATDSDRVRTFIHRLEAIDAA